MTERSLTDADIDALCGKLVPLIEQRLADRFFAAAGRGVFDWLRKLWVPILLALIVAGYSANPKLPQIIATAIKTGS